MCPCSEWFWSVFSRIRTEYGEIRTVLSLNAGKYGHGHFLTPNTDTFYTVRVLQVGLNSFETCYITIEL